MRQHPRFHPTLYLLLKRIKLMLSLVRSSNHKQMVVVVHGLASTNWHPVDSAPGWKKAEKGTQSHDGKGVTPCDYYTSDVIGGGLQIMMPPTEDQVQLARDLLAEQAAQVDRREEEATQRETTQDDAAKRVLEDHDDDTPPKKKRKAVDPPGIKYGVGGGWFSGWLSWLKKSS